MNKVILIGRLTKDPELGFMPTSGKAVERMNNSNKCKVNMSININHY